MVSPQVYGQQIGPLVGISEEKAEDSRPVLHGLHSEREYVSETFLSVKATGFHTPTQIAPQMATLLN